MTITEFIEARITLTERRAHLKAAEAMTGHQWKHYPEDAYNKLQDTTLEHCSILLLHCEAMRRIIELHKAWPVLTTQPPKVESDPLDDPHSTTLRMTQQMKWMTEQEYRNTFSDEPPTSPIIGALAAIWSNHPDYNQGWAPETPGGSHPHKGGNP